MYRYVYVCSLWRLIRSVYVAVTLWAVSLGYREEFGIISCYFYWGMKLIEGHSPSGTPLTFVFGVTILDHYPHLGTPYNTVTWAKTRFVIWSKMEIHSSQVSFLFLWPRIFPLSRDLIGFSYFSTSVSRSLTVINPIPLAESGRGVHPLVDGKRPAFKEKNCQ